VNSMFVVAVYVYDTFCTQAATVERCHSVRSTVRSVHRLRPSNVVTVYRLIRRRERRVPFIIGVSQALEVSQSQSGMLDSNVLVNSGLKHDHNHPLTITVRIRGN